MKIPKCIAIVHLIFCTLFLIPCESSHNSCKKSEIKALLEFRKNIIDESNCLASWVGDGCCSWDGVGCQNGTSNVESLSLSRLDCRIKNKSAVLQGEISPSLSNLKHLRYLKLSDNKFNGSIPTSIGQLPLLEWLDVSNNFLTGVISELHFAKLVNLSFLHMESNMLEWKVSTKWVPPFQLQDISLSSCKLGPEFPSWLRTQRSISSLSLSNTNISGTIPPWFENFVLPAIRYLDLSSNEMSGKVFEFQNLNEYVSLSSNKFEVMFTRFPLVKFIDLSSNLLTGQFPQSYDLGEGFGTLSLRLSNNSLTGPIPQYLCLFNLSFLDLSENHLSGELPSCLGSQEYLSQLDLSNNHLHGQIPKDFFSSKNKSLQSLRLSNNRFQGKVPMSIQNLRFLQLLDIGGNFFTDIIPPWLGSLVWLKVANLQSNGFYGHIPQTLCGLSRLQVLSLAQNNLTGRIPFCFGNFTAMATKYQNDPTGKPNFLIPVSHATSVWFPSTFYIEFCFSGREYCRTTSLRYLIKSIDLSGNNITGEIPNELMNLTELIFLNLSGNRVNGKIPEKIDHLTNLECLDLSKNQLSGLIPLDMSDLHMLSFLNLSYNNLSGRIPGGGQFQTFVSSSYIGNDQLCGQPILRRCPGEKDESPDSSPKYIANNTDQGEVDDSVKLWFYAGILPGLFCGYVGFCTILHLKTSWRQHYFQFIGDCYDWLAVAFAVKTAALRRKFNEEI